MQAQKGLFARAPILPAVRNISVVLLEVIQTLTCWFEKRAAESTCTSSGQTVNLCVWTILNIYRVPQNVPAKFARLPPVGFSQAVFFHTNSESFKAS